VVTPAPLLSIRGLTKTFRQKQGVVSRRAHLVCALDDVSFEIPRGATLGVVGESGSGKSTLGRCILRLTSADSGTVRWHEADGNFTDVTALHGEALRSFRHRMQIVFQDPYNSLNPARPVWQIVGEALYVAGEKSARAIREKAAVMLDAVGLESEHLDRFPHEFSGGQRQRIAIARALIVEPEFLVCDEITSALDTRTQAQVLDLIASIRDRTNITLLFISHDLHTVARVSDEVLVMQSGRIVARGAAQRLFAQPEESYTRMLVAAVPNPDPRQRTFRGRSRQIN